MLALVSPQRREQALRYKHTLGRFCCLKSWLMLQKELSTIGYQLSDFSYNEHGKPYMPIGPYFSLSHCKQGIAVAVSDQPVGVDIEGIRHAEQDLIERTMNREEQARICSDRDFTRLWTQKEAVLKAEGTGIESFEQLQGVLSRLPSAVSLQTIEKDNYIYSIANGKLHCFGA